MINLKIGGVPEHFNMPWHLLLQSGKLADLGISNSWKDYPGGTGDMVNALNSGDLDVATLLTEGAIKGIDQGGDFRILNFFVDSPLIWGIHVPSDSSHQSIEHIRGSKYAISRYGSGSHLISYLDTKNRNWPVEDLVFEEVGGLEGARQAFREKKAEIFLWEKYTTKPLVDQGEFRLLDECNPGFSSFVICVANRVWKDNQSVLLKLLDALLQTNQLLLKNSGNVEIIAKHYQLGRQDVEAWLKTTRWTIRRDVEEGKLDKALTILKELDLIKPTLRNEDLVFDPAG